MEKLKKLMITPYFGKLPDWFDKFHYNFYDTLNQQGYEWLFTSNLNDFNRRCKIELGFDSPIQYGTGKLWDYRGCLGLLYQDFLEKESFDYWGTMDFDVVFGNVAKFFPDDEIEKYDVISNHHSYVCGFYNLYRNDRDVNNLFTNHPDWKQILQDPTATGWVEDKYSRVLEKSGLHYKYAYEQGNPYTKNPNLEYRNKELFQDGKEIAMFHFRVSKKWPL